MSVIEEIVSGWKNYIFKFPEMEGIAKERLGICLSCEKLRKNRTCSLCGCFIPAKVRSPKSKCPINLWGKII
jgi:hypothetical protein